MYIIEGVYRKRHKITLWSETNNRTRGLQSCIQVEDPIKATPRNKVLAHATTKESPSLDLDVS